METHGILPRSADSGTGHSDFRMIDVGEKTATRRRAIAEGRIHVSIGVIEMIKSGTLPKGNVLALAEAAGVMAAKRTSETLPLCHPLPLDAVRVWIEIEERSLCVQCEAIATAKTGVEMEALHGVTAALLCIYDLVKGVDPALTLTAIHLKIKEGGKSGVWRHPVFGAAEHEKKELQSLKGLRAGVLTLSDRCSSGKMEDRSGAYIRDFLSSRGASIEAIEVVGDEVETIRRRIREWAFERDLDLILCTGGTGLGPRDVTPEAIQEMGGKWVPGIGELLRSQGAKHTAMAWISRGEAYLLAHALVIALPGSLSAVKQGLESLEEILSHARHITRGGGHE